MDEGPAYPGQPRRRAHAPWPILLVGATGVFGSRLARGLAALPGVALHLLARDPGRLDALARDLAPLSAAAPGGSLAVISADRGIVDAAFLRARGITLLIDAAGPFQGADLALPRAAIAAGAHYLDLADARDFVARVPALDADARAAGVAVLTGASSTPALSHAALDALTIGWLRIDRVEAAIHPGNRAPRGRAVVEAILSYVGRPLRVFADGDWTEAPGWGLPARETFPGLGLRPVALVETPDLDLMVARYRPREAALFRAGLELGLLHHGLRALAWLPRLGLLASLRPLAGLLTRVATLFERFGTDAGGMTVRALGLDAEGRPTRALWSLVARNGVGPFVPTLPALALVRRFKDGPPVAPGARSCAGLVTLADLAADLEAHGIETRAEAERLDGPGLFAAALGPAFARLPVTTRALHTPAPVRVMQGRAEVEGAAGPLGRLVAAVFGLPRVGRDVALRVVIARDGPEERWTRVFAERRPMRSVMGAPDPATRTVEERFGPFAFRLRLDADEAGLSLTPVSARLGPLPLPLPLPRVLTPRGTSRETAPAPGVHAFDVTITLPLLGRLARYRGTLALDDEPFDDAPAGPPAFDAREPAA